MPQLLFALLLLATHSAWSAAPVAPRKPVPKPVIAFAASENDAHFLELNEWAERNHLLEPGNPKKKLDVLIVGCGGTPECYFFYQKNGRMHVHDPRLKRDWTRTLRKGASLDRLRTMRCFASAVNKGECRVWETTRTRAHLIATAPAMARSLGMFVRSPANVDLVKNRRARR